MNDTATIISLAGVLAAAAPIVFAVIGETISERAGVLNLSMNGMILLSAMGSFGVALATKSVFLGFVTGALIGALVALVVSFASLTLRQSQVAVGFVLTLLCRDLSYFLGNPIMGQVGPRINQIPIPGLKDIPLLGGLFFRQDLMTYLSFVIVLLAWLFIFRTKQGLTLRGIGEKPAAAYVRGADVNRLRYLYAVIGGAIAGLAGPIYSLSVKAGWKGTISGLDGIGWIALSITIFGGWKPFRAMLGGHRGQARPRPPAEPALGALPGPSGGALPPHDPHPPLRQHRQRGVGGPEPRPAARERAPRHRAGPPRDERDASRGPWRALREGVAAGATRPPVGASPGGRRAAGGTWDRAGPACRLFWTPVRQGARPPADRPTLPPPMVHCPWLTAHGGGQAAGRPPKSLDRGPKTADRENGWDAPGPGSGCLADHGRIHRCPRKTRNCSGSA